MKIKNFRGYGENIDREDRCFVYDDLDAPLVIFKGYNGFGKTSFYEAIEWCLTDHVYRLEKFYDDKTYQVNELKKSHYLKFYHPIYGNTSKREIYVELMFSDGLKIVRKSMSNVLRTTEKDSSYESFVFMGYEKLEEVTNTKILNTFISNAKDKEVFFHTHMLGQESISDFLRQNSPSRRRAIFMQLLQEEELNSLYLEIQKYKNGNSLSRKIGLLERQITNYRNDQVGIEEFIKKLEFSDISSYLKTVQSHYLKIKPLIKENIINEDLDLNSIIIADDINLKNCVSLLQNISISQQRITTLKYSLVSKNEDLERFKARVETLEILEHAKNKVQDAEHAKKLLENNLEDLQVQHQDFEKLIKKSKDIKKDNEARVKELITHKNIFSSLKQYIALQDLSINDQFWNQFIIEQNLWKSFSEKYQKEIQKIEMINISIPELNNEWFSKIQEKYNELQFNKNTKLQELENIRNTISNVSSLNSQYQESLSNVKQLLIENPDIENCPVCLNDDFSDEKYLDKNIKKWDSSLDVTEKILSIINSTFASGDEQIEELSQRENDIIENINLLENSIKNDVLERIIERINIINVTFSKLYIKLEEQFNEVINKNINEIEKLKTENGLIIFQIDRMKKSIIALFGEDFKMNNLQKEKLQEFIEKKELWFSENNSKFIFLRNTDSLTEIDYEISLLKEDKENNYNKDELLKYIQGTTKKIEYIEILNSEFNEIIKYKLPVEYEPSLKEFDRISSKIEQISKTKDIIADYRNQVETVYGKLLGKQKRVVKERLENHPIISWVYETINPHPFHKKLHITNSERGTNFIGETQLENKTELYLDQMFSAAQLNILALSIFFGLGLTQRYSKLQQLFLDDPIQSMDDVNILALIDVIRAIMDSRYKNKHIIISTHNEDFAQLIAIKMRNRGVVQYNIVGYTEEGPKISKIK